jgi:hypothetical protein
VAEAARKTVGGVVTRRMRHLLLVTLFLFGLLSFNSVYLGSVTFLGWMTGSSRENAFYLAMFLVHLVLGFLIVVPAIGFGAWHWRRAASHPNRRAVRMGIVAFAAAIVTLVTGVLLIDGDVGRGMRDALGIPGRSAAYWAHVLAPLVVVWGFVLHRLAGRRIRWGTGGRGVARARRRLRPLAALGRLPPAAGAARRRGLLRAEPGTDRERGVHPGAIPVDERLLHLVPRGRVPVLGAQRACGEQLQQPALRVQRAGDAAPGLRARGFGEGRPLLRRLP